MRKRSPRYPFIPLEEAVQILQRFDRLPAGRDHVVAESDILAVLDYSSLHGAAAKVIAAMRAYNLFKSTNGGGEISALGNSILDAESDQARLLLYQKASLSPPALREVWRVVRHMDDEGVVKFLLSRNFSESGARRAARIYRLNDEFSSLQAMEVEPELLDYGRMNISEIPREDTIEDERAQSPDMLRLPLSSGTVVIPKGITDEEFLLLTETLESWRSKLVVG